jgi:hypothetical protein
MSLAEMTIATPAFCAMVAFADSSFSKAMS